jgi:hypothetical protein
MFPIEVYFKILQYVSYETLYGSVRLVNHQFNYVASEIIKKFDLGLMCIFITWEVYFTYF